MNLLLIRFIRLCKSWNTHWHTHKHAHTHIQTHSTVCQGSFKKLQEIENVKLKKMKLYLWLCIVCILLASLPLPSSSLIPFACLSLCGFPCVSVSSAFRLPRVLSHCLCVQLPSAIRRMLTLTLPNALQPLPLFPLSSHLLVLRKCLAKKKEKKKCSSLHTFAWNFKHSSCCCTVFFFSVSFGLVFFFVAFLLFLEASKNKNIFGMCGKYVKRWESGRHWERERERGGKEREKAWVMQKIRIDCLGARKLDLDMDMDMLCRS